MSKNTPERHDVYCDKQYPMIKKIVCNVLTILIILVAYIIYIIGAALWMMNSII